MGKTYKLVDEMVFKTCNWWTALKWFWRKYITKRPQEQLFIARCNCGYCQHLRKNK